MRQRSALDYVLDTRAKNTIFIARIGLWLFVALMVVFTLYYSALALWGVLF